MSRVNKDHSLLPVPTIFFNPPTALLSGMYWTIDRGEESKLYKITERKMKTKSRVHKNYSIWITISLSLFCVGHAPHSCFDRPWSSQLKKLHLLQNFLCFAHFKSPKPQGSTSTELHRLVLLQFSPPLSTNLKLIETVPICHCLARANHDRAWASYALEVKTKQTDLNKIQDKWAHGQMH